MSYLKFISDKDLRAAVGRVIQVIDAAERDAQVKLHTNVLDPFSALFHGITHSLSCTDWIAQEKTRQIQKTMQNAIGDFHQEILGAVSGWKNLGVGGGLDVVNKKMKIIAEVKNKFNTTKGNHRVEIYDAIKSKLKMSEYAGFVGYFVEIIPKNIKGYNKSFTPPDNKTKKRRPAREDMRIIDGVSFYKMATGRANALKELFEVLPTVIADNFGLKMSKKDFDAYQDLFGGAFGDK